MLHIHFMQQWFALTDPAMEEIGTMYFCFGTLQA